MKSSGAMGSVLVFVVASIISCGNRTEAPLQEEVSRFEGVIDVEYDGFEAGSPGGRFVSAFAGKGPTTFNAVVANDESSLAVVDLVYTALVRRNQMTLEWEPRLASGWIVSDDGTGITFTLRDGLRWSDGVPITAHDFEYTYSLIITRGLQGSAGMRFYANNDRVVVEAVDRKNVRFSLATPYAGIFEIAAFYPLPKHIVEPVFAKVGVKEFNTFWDSESDVTTVVGCGPFLLDEYLRDRRLVLRKNPHFFEVDESGTQLPYLEEFVIEYVKNEEEAREKFLSGELDYYELKTTDYEILVGKEAEQPAFDILNAGPVTDSLILAFNQNPIEEIGDAGIGEPSIEWLSNSNFRRAVALLIDRKAIIDRTLAGIGYPQISPFPELSPYYAGDVVESAATFDPEKATLLLDEIEYVDTDADGIREDTRGNEISLILYTNEDNENRIVIGEMLASEAKAIGIDIELKSESFEALITRLLASAST